MNALRRVGYTICYFDTNSALICVLTIIVSNSGSALTFRTVAELLFTTLHVGMLSNIVCSHASIMMRGEGAFQSNRASICS